MEKGSRGLVLLLQDPALVALVLAVVVALVAFVTIRATWTPVAPLRLGRRRSWGQILSASGSMYVRHPRVFLGIGLLLIPVTLVITLLQWLVLEGLGLVGVSSTGEIAGGSAFLALIIGTTLALLGLGLVQAATACALLEIDAGRRITAVSAYAEAFKRVRPLLRAIGLFVLVWVALTTMTFLIPVAIWLAIRWCLLAPIVELEERGGRDALRRSRELTRGRWLRTASLVGLSAAISLGLGPLLGALLIFVVDAPLATLNIVAGIVYAAALPFVGLVTAYVYFDARTRVELEPVVDEGELPAEIELAVGRAGFGHTRRCGRFRKQEHGADEEAEPAERREDVGRRQVEHAALRGHPESCDRRDAERDAAEQVDGGDDPFERALRRPEQAAADLDVREVSRREEAGGADEIGRPDEPVVGFGVEPGLERVERVQVEQHRADELQAAAPPVDAVRLEGDDPKPSRARLRPLVRVDRLQPLQRRRRGEEDRPDEEHHAVDARADELHEAGERPDQEAGRPEGEEHPDPPRHPVRSPPDARVTGSRQSGRVLAMGS